MVRESEHCIQMKHENASKSSCMNIPCYIQSCIIPYCTISQSEMYFKECGSILACKITFNLYWVPGYSSISSPAEKVAMNVCHFCLENRRVVHIVCRPSWCLTLATIARGGPGFPVPYSAVFDRLIQLWYIRDSATKSMWRTVLGLMTVYWRNDCQMNDSRALPYT